MFAIIKFLDNDDVGNSNRSTESATMMNALGFKAN